MKTTNETYTESNYSSLVKETNQRNSLGNFPLLKFKENLYNTCQTKFSQYINNKKSDLKLIVNNKINQQISITDYFNNSPNDKDYSNKLTPIPSINKRKIKNEGEKKELKNFQRNVVLMRRLEYANKMKEKNLKKKYKNQINQIILLQKMIRGYLVRKVINQVNIINETLINFLFLISFCIKKKYFYYLKNKILTGWMSKGVAIEDAKNEKIIKENNINENFNLNSNNINENYNLNTNNETTKRNDYINIDNEYKLTNNENFFCEGNNALENNINDSQILKEKINIIDNNINEINKEEVNLVFNINDKVENNFINYDNKQDRITTDINNDNNDKYNSKEKRSMALLNAQLNEIKNKGEEENAKYNDINTNNNNNNNNNNLIKINSPTNQDSIIENDEYIDFFGKRTLKKNSKKINKNYINDNNLKNIPNRNPLNNIASEASENNIKRIKIEIIQRQFRRYLCKKGFYGKFDKRKIIIVYLLKNKVLSNIKIYVFNLFLLIYKEIKNISITQEDNYFNLSSERIENVKQIFNNALSHIK